MGPRESMALKFRLLLASKSKVAVTSNGPKPTSPISGTLILDMVPLRIRTALLVPAEILAEAEKATLLPSKLAVLLKRPESIKALDVELTPSPMFMLEDENGDGKSRLMTLSSPNTRPSGLVTRAKLSADRPSGVNTVLRPGMVFRSGMAAMLKFLDA